ncbi:beta-fructofuranosidase, insoluble isoenzyme 1-like protein [Cinnamomum micranthum f. kanehirae]|uniref:Beta-fructofuranosidase, insoluble isoenzyme 1-like protein n=1 Tax=Cinnamomum micranthum f. kanehirae TaxID=337451 RepID=A0A3S3P5M2_9MAGN|nr:beta-fructofuranosidase, insoluble isoenzyme 1-like protein [Cinnamomum micranthum f. kanehirae]
MGSLDLRFSIWVIFLCCFSLSRDVVEASHEVFLNLQSFQPITVSQNHRTGFHFQPPKNWINDPNGPMYYNGIYHLFYQYNPKGAVWGNIEWAHSVSTDLINWSPVEPAIYPSEKFDINGCWSGSATILPGNKPVILYTGVDQSNRQVQNAAIPKNLADPYLKEWIKPSYNPVILPDKDINASSFRDPTTAWQGPDGQWRVVIGSKTGKEGTAILYKSKDFIHWEKAQHYLHSSKETGMWECPDIYPVSGGGRRDGLDTLVVGKGVKHVFKVSLDDTKLDYYTIGQYQHDTDQYVPDRESVDNKAGLRYDHGKFYASKTFYDAGKKRRVLWGWMNESDTVPNDIAKGWAGLQSIPRMVWLDKNERQLVQWPVDEVESLRDRKVKLFNKVLVKGEPLQIKGLTAEQADVDVEFEIESLEKAEAFDPSWTDPQILCSHKGVEVEGVIGPFGLKVLASKGLEEYTAIFFRVFKAKQDHVVLMCSDQSRSSKELDIDKTTYGGFVDVNMVDRRISLRSLIDHSVVESFGGGGRTCITTRVYPTMDVEDQANLYVFNKGSETVKISKLKAWSMKKAEIA